MVLPESVQAQENFNLWDRSNNNRNIPRQAPQKTADEDLARRISESFQQDMNPSTGQQWQSLLSYGLFVGVVAVSVVAFICWQMWRHRRMEWELNDPVFLVQELNSAHQLSEQEKRLMRELSEKHLLPSSLKLFVEPKFLLDAWDSDTFLSSRSEIQQLLSKLFDIAKA